MNWRMVSQYAALLLGSVPVSEFDLETLQRIHARLAGIEEGAEDPPQSLSEAVNAIETTSSWQSASPGDARTHE